MALKLRAAAKVSDMATGEIGRAPHARIAVVATEAARGRIGGESFQANDVSSSPWRVAEQKARNLSSHIDVPHLHVLSDSDFASFVPWATGVPFPGDGSAFVVARGWALNFTRPVVAPRRGYVVQPRGLTPA